MRHRSGFAGLLTAEIISLLGSQMTFVALPWLVLSTTGSATKTGLVAASGVVAYVLTTAIGGPLIDQFGARRTAITADVVSAAIVASIPIVYAAGGLQLWLLCTLVGGAGMLRGFGNTAKTVIFPHLVRTADVEMARATTLQDLCSRGATLLGAPLAGVLVATLDPPTVLYIDAFCFSVSAVLVATFVRRLPPPEPLPEADRADSYVGAIGSAVRYLRADRLILGIVAVFFATNLFDAAHSSVFVPVWARELLGSPVGIGLVSGAFALGAVLGNLSYVALAPKLPRYAPFAVGLLIGGAPRFVALGLDSPLWTLLAVNFAAGVGLSVVNPILGAVLYERVPGSLQARVFGLAQAVCFAGIPLGSVGAGLLSDQIGLRTTTLIAAGGYLIASLVPILSARWRGIERQAPALDPAASTPAESLSQAEAGDQREPVSA